MPSRLPAPTLNRRRVILTGAWSVPAVSLAAASPAFALSEPALAVRIPARTTLQPSDRATLLPFDVTNQGTRTYEGPVTVTIPRIPNTEAGGSGTLGLSAGSDWVEVVSNGFHVFTLNSTVEPNTRYPLQVTFQPKTHGSATSTQTQGFSPGAPYSITATLTASAPVSQATATTALSGPNLTMKISPSNTPRVEQATVFNLDVANVGDRAYTGLVRATIDTVIGATNSNGYAPTGWTYTPNTSRPYHTYQTDSVVTIEPGAHVRLGLTITPNHRDDYTLVGKVRLGGPNVVQVGADNWLTSYTFTAG